MATQRVVVAKIGGNAAGFVRALFQRWQPHIKEGHEPSEISDAVDAFSEQLIAQAHRPPVVYFTQWIDQWSMGDIVPGLGNCSAEVVPGIRYQACLHIPPIKAKIKGDTQESIWLKRRIEEAEDAWKELAPDGVIIVLREVLGGLVTDEELRESLNSVPLWLASPSNSE